MWRSLRVRLSVSIILAVLAAVAVMAFVTSRRTAGEFQRFVEIGGALRDRRVVSVLERAYSRSGTWEAIQAEAERIGQIGGRRVVVTNRAGTVVADSESRLVGQTIGPGWSQPAAQLLVGGTRVGSVYVDPVGPAEGQGADFLLSLNRNLLVGCLIAGLAAVAVSLVLSSRILRPVERLTAAARQMEKGDLSVRVPIESDDEIGQLAHAFNAMAGGLAGQEELRRNMVGDVAHELRTPLTNLRGYLQAARDGVVPVDGGLVDNLYEETMLLSRLVTDLQDLAQAEAGQLALDLQPVALPAALEQAVEAMRRATAQQGMTLTLDAPTDLPLARADAGRVGQVVRNLLNNAVAHTQPGGSIAVRAGVDGGMIRVSVRDTGEGIPDEHLPYVFDRFYRADKSRARQTGGAGLGLAIVKQLVAAMGGSVYVTSAVGRGSEFSFTLPVWTGK